MRSFNLSLWSVRNRAVTLFLILVALAAGGSAYLSLGRAEDPSFTVKSMIVQAVWPGATAEEMQNLVADPLEKRIQELPELDYVKTYSRPGVTVLTVQLKDQYRGTAVTDVWYQVRKKVGDARPDLPEGVIGPFFDDEYGDVFSAIFMLTGDGASLADLKRYSEQLRARLLRVERCRQGRADRRCRAAHFRRDQPDAPCHAGAFPARHLRRHRAAECRHLGRIGADERRRGAGQGQRRSRYGRGAAGFAHRGRRADVAVGRHRDDPPGIRRPARVPCVQRGQARGRRRRVDGR